MMGVSSQRMSEDPNQDDVDGVPMEEVVQRIGDESSIDDVM